MTNTQLALRAQTQVRAAGRIIGLKSNTLLPSHVNLEFDHTGRGLPDARLLLRCTWCSSVEFENVTSISRFFYVTQITRISLVLLTHTARKIDARMRTQLWRKLEHQWRKLEHLHSNTGTVNGLDTTEMSFADAIALIRNTKRPFQVLFERRISVKRALPVPPVRGVWVFGLSLKCYEYHSLVYHRSMA